MISRPITLYTTFLIKCEFRLVQLKNDFISTLFVKNLVRDTIDPGSRHYSNKSARFVYSLNRCSNKDCMEGNDFKNESDFPVQIVDLCFYCNLSKTYYR